MESHMEPFCCRVCGEGLFEESERYMDMYECLNCGVLFKSPTRFSLPTVKFIKLTEDGLEPKKAKPGDVAFDLFAAHGETILPGETKLIKTNIAIELPRHHEGQVRCRSSFGKKGIMVANGVGTIDSGYRGDVGILLHNSTTGLFKIEKHDRIAQLLIMPKLPYRLKEVNILSDTARGAGGFGSTGV